MYRRTKLACYATNLSMSVVGNLSPLLFITFKNLYGISYSLLGLLVLINFCTQLTVDLIFSFFSHKFNIKKTVRSIPFITMLGLLIFALSPYVFGKNVFVGLALGTVIFSASGGLMEVLISPVIAAIPSKNPERDMSKLHSVYAWGVVFVIIIGTVFITFCDSELWPILALAFISVPLVAAILFIGAEIPDVKNEEKGGNILAHLKNKTLWLCVFAIFLGGASECTMSQWSSGYLENALGLPKIVGDIFGVALFALTLGLGRTLYSKKGKEVERVLLLGSIGAFLCYVITVVSPFPIISLAAAAFTGFCTSMLWPGCLIVSADKFPEGGVFIYAMMASGGDLGASVVPQLVGIVSDVVGKSDIAETLAQTVGGTAEQIGMKAGMLVASLFPMIAIFVFTHILRTKKERNLCNGSSHT